MDEGEFRRILELFPVVRSRDYHADLDVSRQSSRSGPSTEAEEWQDAWSTEDGRGYGYVWISEPYCAMHTLRIVTDHVLCQHAMTEAFWGKLKSAAEKKVGAADAERFCKAFQQVYKKLVYEELTSDTARRILNSRTF